MRLSAYKKALEETNDIPNNVPELERYLMDRYSPMDSARRYILDKARADSGLMMGEFVELYEYFLTQKALMEIEK